MLSMWTAWILLLFQLSCSALGSVQPLDVVSADAVSFTALETQTKAFGFQDAFNTRYGSTNGTITLFPHACLQNDGTPNCTAACLDHTQMFSDLETLHNCALFPEISVRLAEDSLTSEARSLAEELKITPSSNDASLPTRISNAIQQCLLDSCRGNQDCAARYMTPISTNQMPSSDYLNGTTYLALCAPIPAYITADVGGVGVWPNLALYSTSAESFTRSSSPTSYRWV